MCLQEKWAWFCFAVATLTFTLYGVFMAIPRLRPGASAAFALLAIIAAEAIIGRKTRSGRSVVFDERDQQISGFSSTAGFGVLWVIYLAVALIPLAMLGPEKRIFVTTSTLAQTVFPAIGIWLLVRSLVMILLYRKQAHE